MVVAAPECATGTPGDPRLGCRAPFLARRGASRARTTLWTVLTPLALAVVALALVLALWAAAFALRDRAVVLRQLWGAAVVEAALVVQAIVAVAVVVGGAGVDEPATFWGYVACSLIVLPIAAAWAFAERTRWSSVVLLVAAVTVAFLQWRLLQVWGAP